MSDYQLGVKNESVYGTPVTVDTFLEFLPGDAIAPETGRTDSQGLRAKRYVGMADRFQPYQLGAAGSRSFEVLTKGAQWFLLHMMGALTSTPDAPVSGVTEHVAIFGDLCGKSFTWQDNVVGGACKNVNNPVTYHGGKINSWSLSCSVEGNLTLEIEVVFAGWSTATALAVASYPSGLEVMSWATGSAQLDGASVPITSWTLSCNNNLKTDRHYIAGSGAAPGTHRKEPVPNGDREVTFECELDFTNLNLWSDSVSTVRGDTLIPVSILTEGPIPITGSTYPALEITIPAFRLDEVSLGQLQQEMSTQSVSGVVLDNGTDQPLTLKYRAAS